MSKINIYCDESRHTSGEDDFMVIGAICCPKDLKREMVYKINFLKEKYQTQGEFGWKRLSPNRRAFYLELIELFINSPLNFKCIVVDKRELNHERYNNGDKELGFYKLYYQMLTGLLKSGHKYSVYVDWQVNQKEKRFSDLKFYLDKRKIRATIGCLEPVSSETQPLIQLADLLMGAIGYQYNNRKESSIKVEFCGLLATKLHTLNPKYFRFGNLKTFTAQDEEKFNIFRWRPKQ
jgi:hypothetical protein